MKKLYQTTLLIGLLLTSLSLSAQEVSKTLVKSFNPAGATQAELNLEGPVEIKSWSNSIVRVQMNISLSNGNVYTLKGLVQAGRYNLKGEQADDKLVISAPGLAREVVINGRALEENISYTVYLPKQMATDVGNPVTSTSTADSF